MVLNVPDFPPLAQIVNANLPFIPPHPRHYPAVVVVWPFCDPVYVSMMLVMA